MFEFVYQNLPFSELQRLPAVEIENLRTENELVFGLHGLGDGELLAAHGDARRADVVARGAADEDRDVLCLFVFFFVVVVFFCFFF